MMLTVLILSVLFIVYILFIRPTSESKYFCVSSGAGDADRCYLKSDYSNKEKAITTGNAEICLNLEERETSSAFNQYIECVEKVAVKNKSLEICQKYFSDPHNIKHCIYSVVRETKDILSCDGIGDASLKLACQDYIQKYVK